MEITTKPRSRKRVQNNDSKDDPGSWGENGGKNRGDARNVSKDLEKSKNKQSEMNNKYTKGINTLKESIAE